MNSPNVTCDALEALLPDYFEGSLSDASVADVELHLAACAACRALVNDLRNITQEAKALVPLTPSRDLWPGIANRIEAKVLPFVAPAGRLVWSPVRLAAVAAALVGITAWGTYAISTRDRNTVVTPSAPNVATVLPDSAPAARTAPSPAPSAPEATTAVAVARRTPRLPAAVTYSTEIDRLKRVFQEQSEQLDPRTVAILETSLATIDSAIVRARIALARDPNSKFLSEQVDKSLQQKLGLLRTAVLLAPST